MTKKRYFTCPVHEDEDIKNIYTTDECRDCWCFWDCETGIQECLKDEDFVEYFDELEKGLKELKNKW